MLNKEEIKYKKIKSTKALVFMCPQKKFKTSEFKDMEKFIEDGKTIIYMSGMGGELKSNTNFNYLLEKYGMFVNDDTVIRT